MKDSFGLPIPVEGANCFSKNPDSQEHFFLSLTPDKDSADLINVELFHFGASLDQPRLEFSSDDIKLFPDQTFNGFGNSSLFEYKKLIGILEREKDLIFGKHIKITQNRGKTVFSCYLGRKNPFYSNHDILILSQEKYGIGVKQDSKKNALYVFAIFLGIAGFIFVVIMLYLVCFKWKSKMKQIINTARPHKIQVI